MNKIISREYVEKNYIHKDKIIELLNKSKKYIDGSYKDYEVLQVIYKGLKDLLEDK